MIGMSALFSRIRLAADDPFRDPNVRLLFGAQGISILGSQVSHIAFPLIAVDVISASNGAIALLEAAFLLPFVFFSLPVGALLDRRTRRPVMVAMDLVRTAALLLIPLSYAIGGPTTPAPESTTIRRLFATARRGPRSSSGKYDWVATSKMSVAVPMIKSVR